MKPEGSPNASLIIASLHLELRGVNGPVPYLEIYGRGILAPGMVIPGEWWERPGLIDHMEVDKPEPTADGVMAVDFRGRCTGANCQAMCDVIAKGDRELRDREIIPRVLVQLWMLPGRKFDFKPTAQMVQPIGTAVDWEPMSPPPTRPHASVFQDLLKLSLGQGDGINRKGVLQEAAAQGMLSSDQLLRLLEQTPPPPLILKRDDAVKLGMAPKETTAPRRRVRVVDTE